MKVRYDPQHDILRIRFSDEQIEESKEPAPGFIIDYSAAGKIVGLESLTRVPAWKPAHSGVRRDSGSTCQRIILNFEAESENISADEVVRDIIAAVPQSAG